MKNRCSLRRSSSSDGQDWPEVLDVLHRADTAAGAQVVSDQALLEARAGRRELHLVFASDDQSTIVGVAILSEHEFDLVIDPAHRARGIGSCALQTVLAQTSGSLATWVHGDNPAATALLHHAHFQPVRTLLKMSLAAAEIKPQELEQALPNGYLARAFTPADASDWVQLNARVFAAHPEQGSLTEADLAARMSEAWFDSNNFLLVHDDDEALIAYCWLKVVDGEGEVYVIGVAPEASGTGLGGALFDLGMRRLMNISQGSSELERVSLYVDSDNERAVSLYRSRGFTEVFTSRQWMFNRS